VIEIADRIISPAGNQLSISVIGCGGTGSLILPIIARFNYALKALKDVSIALTCFDGDKIDIVNPCRQGFSPYEVGLHKNVALITRINRFWGTSWEAIPEMLTSKTTEFLGNIVISATDTRKSRKMIYNLIRNQNKAHKINTENHVYYWIDLGNSLNTGNVILSDCEKLPTPLDYYKNSEDIDIDKPSCSIAESLNNQNILINQEMANKGAQLLWDILTNESIKYRGFFINLEKSNFKRIKA
jgi:PRTRC genetic system ThiF family protein